MKHFLIVSIVLTILLFADFTGRVLAQEE